MGQNAFGDKAALREEGGQNALANNGGCIQKLAPNGQDIHVNLTQKLGQSGLAINRGINSKCSATEESASAMITGLFAKAVQHGLPINSG